ncbi:MAG: response regulator [Candidatus Krumholzibacteriia bacterium]
MPTILIIEDDDDVRAVLEAVLARAGYRVRSARDGKEGVVAAAGEPVDLVITDIIMPEKDGIETITDLRREHPDLKVIAISGGGRFSPGGYLHSARLLGADLTLSKPFGNDEILRAVERLLAP